MKKRVQIPVNNAAQVLELAKKVMAKHQADGAKSPLNLLDWATIAPLIESAIVDHETASNLRLQMLKAYEKRGVKLRTIVEALRNSRDILIAANFKEMKTLGDWGYTVSELRKSPAETKPEPQSKVA